MPSTRADFRKWLQAAIERLNSEYAHPDAHHGVWESCAAIAVEAGDIAAQLGLPDLHQRSLAFDGLAEPLLVKTFLADCIAGCGAKPPAAPGRFLTIDAAATHSGLSPESIRRMISSGKLTPLRPVKGRVLLDRLELESVVRSSDSRPRTGRGIKR